MPIERLAGHASSQSIWKINGVGPLRVVPLAEVLNQTLAGAQSECQNGDGRCLVGTEREDASVATVKVLDVVGLPKTIGHKLSGIISHPARTGFVQAPAGDIGSFP